MQVLLINSSPHARGCTWTALSEVAAELERQGIGSHIFQLGTQPVAGCLACGMCRKTGRCFRDDKVNEALALVPDFDAFIFGTPVYYASASGQLESFMDRLFFCGSSLFANKPGAAVVSCRRGGASAAFEQVNKYFGLMQMPIITSRYWPIVHGACPEDVRKDLEGMQTMRTLGKNMAHLLKCREKAAIPFPVAEPWVATNFIS